MQQKKLAIVCDWLTNMGGAEKVILALHRMFPKAPIFTTLYDPDRVKGFEQADIRTSYLQKIPFARKHHQLMLPWMLQAVESFNLDDYDIVISSSHSVAKGIITKPETIHICYCHTPMRYAWEPWELNSRLVSFPRIFHNRIRREMHKIRIWDRLTAERVDHFIANSQYVAARISKYYRKKATVIYPPVSLYGEERCFERLERSEYAYLMVGRLIPYKRHDLVIEAFNILKKPLIIVGEGPEERRLKRLAGPTIQFLGRVTDDRLGALYSECLALIFPQIEDFGLSAVECMASGRPVIAYDAGGARETVIDGQTGILFPEQSVECLCAAVQQCERMDWDSAAIRRHAEKFSEKRFCSEIDALIRHRAQD